MLWTLLLPLGSAFAQDPVAVLAVGARPASSEATAPLPDSWVQALQDCLNEKRPEGFHVVDRRIPGETLTTLRSRLTDLSSLSPAHLVIRLGPAPDPEALSTLLDGVPSGAPPPSTILLPHRATPVSQAPGVPEEPPAAPPWQSALVGREGVIVLGEGPWHLTEQGNARVGAELCDAILTSAKTTP